MDLGPGLSRNITNDVLTVLYMKMREALSTNIASI